MRDQAGDDETDPSRIGNENPFWRARDYVAQARNVRASVFMVNGMNDLNVKPLHAGPWWSALAANDVPRRVWLTQMGHEDPFYADRDAWLPTLHRWFDYWLADVDNGVMDEPLATIEREPTAVGAAPRYETDTDWPSPGVRLATLWTTDDGLGIAADATAAPSAWTDDVDQTQDQAIGADGSNPGHSLAFLTPPLARDVRLSGSSVLTARIQVDGAITSAALGAMLVDYGPGDYPVVDYADGHGATWTATEACMPEADGSGYDSPCFGVRERTFRLTDREVVSRGAVDIGNRNSLETKTPLAADTDTWVKVPLWTKDYVFAAGHRIGLVIVGSYPQFESVPPDNGALGYTLDTSQTTLALPLVGGADALAP
jgi:X-Pro dipeptidyl-peptidase